MGDNKLLNCNVGQRFSSTSPGASIRVSDGGGGGKSKKNCIFFGALCTQYLNIGLCAHTCSVPKILTLCMFIGIFI